MGGVGGAMAEGSEATPMKGERSLVEEGTGVVIGRAAMESSVGRGVEVVGYSMPMITLDSGLEGEEMGRDWSVGAS